MNNNSHLADRKYIVSGFFIVVAMVYICRLFYIQIVDEQYKLDARNNAFNQARTAFYDEDEEVNPDADLEATLMHLKQFWSV